jgi:hypothetical protein
MWQKNIQQLLLGERALALKKSFQGSVGCRPCVYKLLSPYNQSRRSAF